MSSNVEEVEVIKRSSAFFGMSEIAEQFDRNSDVIERSHRHKLKDSTSDERQILEDLHACNQFKFTSNREFHLLESVIPAH